MGKLVEKLEEKYKDATYNTFVQGNFTLVEVVYRGKRAFGIAKRNCDTDPYVPDRGLAIAESRALRNLANGQFVKVNKI